MLPSRLACRASAQVDDGLEALPFYESPKTEHMRAIKYPLYHFLQQAPRNTEADVGNSQQMDSAVREHWNRYAAEAQGRGQGRIFEYPQGNARSIAQYLKSMVNVSFAHGHVCWSIV